MLKSQRQLVDPDRPIRLSPATQRALLRAEMNLAKEDPTFSPALERCLRRHGWAADAQPGIGQLRLRHYLSGELERITPLRPLEAYRSFGERNVLTRMSAQLMALDAGAGAEASRSLLERVCTMVTGGAGALRRGEMRLNAKNGAVEILMPSAREALARVSEIGRLMALRPHPSPIVHAAFLLLVVVNAHAFHDGNGRLSRLVFNHCLHRHGVDNRVYLPLYEASHVAAGAYEITLRRAELHWEWDEFIRYFCTVIELVRG